ncbi:radical SAM protein [Tropicimonas sp. TH_r6]|uniref:B12-binding domain-containing radical SAM protein n=1 Tax=Tropicimonas sp. TH_r6 TaxID=3082085 RepID=UPI002953D0EE|nr:radical SAM protein [Tropicimonas sp. TH_r6]MDV7143290.1 radical SAM protein [Tropicimonas sp. TH_r6]
MHIVFLEIDTEAEWAVCSLGPAFLAGVAREAGHSAELLRIGSDWTNEHVVRMVSNREPDLLGMSLTSRQWLRGREIAGLLREAGDWPMIAGGLHATFSPERVLEAPGFDAVCLGEGEAPFVALLAHLSSGGQIRDASLRNIWVDGGTHPGLAPPIPEIDSIPFMARDMLDEHPGVVHMATQRGCPFPCTYCAARMYDQLYEGIGSYGRRRSVENVMAELTAIANAGPLHYVIFLDDTFTIHHPWVFEFCEVFPRKAGVGFSIHARAETMNPKLIDALARAGCKHVVYGVESGSERIRRDVMKRPVSNDRLIDVFRRTREAGIMATANYMLGIPGEKPADLVATMELHSDLRPLDFGYFVFYPFPGTQLFELCRQNGYLPEKWEEMPARHDRSILDLPDLSPEDITNAYAKWGRIREAETRARTVVKRN